MTPLNKRQWAIDLLSKQFSNYSPSPILVAFLWGWQQQESGNSDESGANYNPLNTTLKLAGSTMFNSAGVQNYTSYEQGLTATYETLVNGFYENIVQMFASNDPIQLGGPAIAGDLSIWVSGSSYPVASDYVLGIQTLAALRFQDLQKGDTMPLLPEVASFVDISQFWPGKTEFACGFYSAGTVKYCGQSKTLGAPHDIEVWADQQYVNEYGEDIPTDTGGVSVDDMHRLIKTPAGSIAGQHYQDLLAITSNSSQSSDIQHVKAALQLGYPVIATIVETSVYDNDLQRNPYWWGASGTHVFVITGMQDENTYLVRDSANVVGSLQGPNSVQPGPRKYDATRLDIVWATMVQTSWLSTPPSDPTQQTTTGDDMALPIIVKSKTLNSDQAKQAQAMYADDATWQSLIADCYKVLFANGVNCGAAIGKEESTIDLSGNQVPIIVRHFSQGVRIEYNTKTSTPRAFTLLQEFKFE